MTRMIQKLSKPVEFAFVTLVCAGVFLVGAIVSLLRGRATFEYTTMRLGWVIVFDVAAALLVVCVLSVRGWSIRSFRLRVDAGSVIAGVLLGLGAVAAVSVGVGIATYLLPSLRIQARIHYAAPVWLVLLFILVNSLFEEGFLIGYVYQTLESRSVQLAFVTSAAIRASYHVYQGVGGAIAIFLVGLLFALMFLRTRHLGLPVVAHTTMNLFLFAMKAA